jgi:hypothetical protein
MELNDLQSSFAQSSHSAKDSTFNKKMTLSELVCQTECPSKYVDGYQQRDELIQLDKKASKALIKDI